MTIHLFQSFIILSYQTQYSNYSFLLLHQHIYTRAYANKMIFAAVKPSFSHSKMLSRVQLVQITQIPSKQYKSLKNLGQNP